MAGKIKMKGVDWSESSSESSLSYRKQDNRFPCRASDWTTEHLLDLGIHYKETFTDLPSFMLSVKELHRKIQGEDVNIPEIYKNILQHTKDRWNFSFDFNKETHSNDDSAVLNGIKQSRDAMESLKLKEDDTMQNDGASLEVYTRWRLNLIEFWHHFVMILRRWRKDYPRVERYTILFMAFSRVCLLVPELGKAYCEAFSIKDFIIRGMPDVRFVAAPPLAANRLSSFDSQILIVTEVNEFDAFRGDYSAETFSSRNVSKRVLGQHGIQLLMERSSSFFCPGVVGVLCIGTKIILSFLNITWDHYRRIKEKGNVDDNAKATISYTRPYDFLDVSDRGEIMEALFWFGKLKVKLGRQKSQVSEDSEHFVDLSDNYVHLSDILITRKQLVAFYNKILSS